MASENELSSDSIDGYITKISGDDVDYLKKKIAKHLLEAKHMSAEIHHSPEQPARLYITFGSSSNPQEPTTRISNKLLVTNLPEAADEEHLEMFFEHTKRQGGGSVKSVSLYPDNKSAVIDFEEADAVQRVLDKQPIKMLGTTVEVEKYEPYLDKNESLKCIEIGGIQSDLVREVADMKLTQTMFKDSLDTDSDDDALNDVVKQMTFANRKLQQTIIEDDSSDDDDLFSLRPQPGKNFKHVGFGCDGCNGPICGIRYRCTRCLDFDFCSSCRNKVPHDLTHKFKEIKHPLMR